MDRESCVLALPHGNTTFRTTSVKPWVTEKDITELVELDVDSEPRRNPPRKRGRPRKEPADFAINYEHFLQLDANVEQFAESRHAEVLGLIAKDVFEITTKSEVLRGSRIFNSRFVDEVKNKGTSKEFMKSRLVVQAYNDDEKRLVLTQSPTIQRVSQRIILCIAAITQETTRLYLRDISQAYIQSTTSLNRDFYIKPPRELVAHLNLQEGAILKVIKPLYSVPEAGNH
jgi:Cu2+-containing amine oxidase